MNQDRFFRFKSEIMSKAGWMSSDTRSLNAAGQASNMHEFMKVVLENAVWCFRSNVITREIIQEYREELRAYNIFLNEDTDHGYVLADEGKLIVGGDAVAFAYDCEVVAKENAIVYANNVRHLVSAGRSRVIAYGMTSIVSLEKSCVSAYDVSRVVGYDSSRVRAFDLSCVHANDLCVVDARQHSSVLAMCKSRIYAEQEASVEAGDNSLVEASGLVRLYARGQSTVRLYGKAIAYMTECSRGEARGDTMVTLQSEGKLYAGGFSVVRAPGLGVFCELSDQAVLSVPRLNAIRTAQKIEKK